MSRPSDLTRWQYAVRSSRLSGIARGVALTMSLRMDSRTLETTVGVDRLARESGWSESSVHKALAELRRNGFLWVTHRGGGYRQLSNLYRGTFPRWFTDGNSEKNTRGF